MRIYLNKSQPSSQTGSHKEYADDHLLALTLLLERVHGFNVQLWAISLDLSRAFNRVNWNKLWNALESQAPQYLIDAFGAIFSDQLGVVRGGTLMSATTLQSNVVSIKVILLVRVSSMPFCNS